MSKLLRKLMPDSSLATNLIVTSEIGKFPLREAYIGKKALPLGTVMSLTGREIAIGETFTTILNRGKLM